MRGTTPDLGTAYPLGALLPALLQEDPLLMRFTEAIDEVLAPAISALDCLAAYVDPALAPPDYLGWLAGWVGIDLDETWPVELQRAEIARAVTLHRGRGTVDGLRQQLELVTGGQVEVVDTGGISWSVEPVDEGDSRSQRQPGEPDRGGGRRRRCEAGPCRPRGTDRAAAQRRDVNPGG